MKEKDIKKINKITDAYEKIVSALDIEPDVWKDVSITGWAKKTKDGLLIENIRLYVNGRTELRSKHWWEFWRK